MITIRWCAVLAAALLSATVAAQERQRGERAGVEYTGPVHPHVSRGELRAMPKMRAWQPGDPVKEIPKRRRPPLAPPLVTPEPRMDPLLRDSEPTARVNRVFSSPTVDVAGQGFTGVNPPDTVGDVGPNHYVQAINSGGGTVVTVYTKAGAVSSGPTTLDTLGSGDCADGLGDPVVLYDHLADRWLLSEFSAVANKLCVYVSTTNDPGGAYYNYEFGTPNFPDYPKYSVWPDAYYVTSNEDSPAIYALERQQMLEGGAARMLRTTAAPLAGFGFQALTPVDVDGAAPPPAGSPGVFVRHRDDEVHGSPALADAGSWQTFNSDISGIALGSSTVVFRFSFDTVDKLSNNFEGFHIDDVVVNIDGTTDVFTEDVEGDVSAWTLTGLWNTTTACSASTTGHSAPTTFYYGQDTGGGGPACDYNTPPSANSGFLTSPVIDLSTGSSATLTFNYFLETEQGCIAAGGPYDVARVEISTDGGATFDAFGGNCMATPTAGDQLQLFEFAVDWVPVTPTGQFTGPTDITIADIDSDLCGLTSINCFPQPGSGTTLDPLREVVMWRAGYRNFGTHQTIVGNLVTDVNGANQGGIRWFELRKPNGGVWSLQQEGTHAPDSVNRWMGSIAMDGAGNIALGYNVSDATSVFPGIRYAGRLATDTPGTLPVTETTLVAGAAANGNNRYGDYSAMSVDPADDCSFWFTGEHNPAANWATRIGAFAFDGCTPVVTSSCSGMSPFITSTTFDQDTLCVGSQSWAAGSVPPPPGLRSIGSPVSVSSNSTLQVFAPGIRLGPEFSVESGSVLKLGAQ